MTRGRSVGTAAALGVAAFFAVTVSARASFVSQSTASMQISTGTLQPATSPAAARGACDSVAQTRAVTVSWTASSSTFADGYEILRSTSNGGPYTSIGTVSGQTTVSYSDTTVAASTKYYYVVKAKKNSWRSAATSQVSVTTPNLLCL